MDSKDLAKIKMDVLVINKDGKRDLFKCISADKLVKMQVAVSLGDGFLLSDEENLIAYAPGTVARVKLVENDESKEPK